MQVHLKVTNLETGERKDVTVDAASPEAALDMYKGTTLHADLAAKSPPKHAPEPTKIFGYELPEWVLGPDGGKGAVTQLFVALGIIAILVGVIVTVAVGEQRGVPPIVIFGWIGVGLFAFLVIFFLAKIANKKG